MIIIPAILESDFKVIQSKIKKIEGIFDAVQIDIGDGKFVSDEFGCLSEINTIETNLSLEIHLMTEKPWDKLEFLKNKKIENNFKIK